MILADTVRLSMRISHDKLNNDIQRNINACLLDLKRVGISTESADVLIEKACELYCKWQYDYQGKAEQYQINYENLRDSMSLAGDYRA